MTAGTASIKYAYYGTNTYLLNIYCVLGAEFGWR